MDVAIGDFIVKGLRVVDGQNGLFLAFPSEKGKDGKWYDVVYPVTQQAKDNLSGVVLEAYQQ